MAAITSTGLGSGLDIEGMVTKLVAAEGQAPTARLKAQGTKLQTNLSALGVLQNALANFQTSVQGLSRDSNFQARVASSNNTAAFTVTTDGTAIPANYPVTVTQLAQSAVSRTGDFLSSTTLVGAGTLDIKLGTSSFTISADASTTLAGVRDAINNATDNPGIKATLIQVDSGTQLVLSSSVLGAANKIEIAAHPTTPEPNKDLNRFATATATTPSSLTPIVDAMDASLTVTGQTVTRQSNNISDVIPGVTISLVGPTSTVSTLAITTDTSNTQSKINSFITAYNALSSTIASQTSYNAATKTAGVLSGDSTLRSLKSQIDQALSNPVETGSSTYSTLVSIGITKDKNGVLSLDTTKFTNALSTNPAAVSSLFTSTNGVAAKLNTQLTNALTSGGSITTRVAGVNQKLGDLAKQQTALNVRLAATEARYRAQFTAMDNLMGKMQSTGTYLNQQYYKTTTN